MNIKIRVKNDKFGCVESDIASRYRLTAAAASSTSHLGANADQPMDRLLYAVKTVLAVIDTRYGYDEVRQSRTRATLPQCVTTAIAGFSHMKGLAQYHALAKKLGSLQAYWATVFLALRHSRS
jgi:hypothetical protein